MGVWGPAILSDDVACDIRDEYHALLMIGKTSEEATQYLLETDYPEIQGTEDETVFWLALALSQWKKGRLLPEVKQQAIAIIDAGTDLERWQQDEKLLKKRITVLQKLKDTLNSPMPAAKKMRPPSVWHSPWAVGDLLAYQITNPTILYPEFLHKYVLLRVIKIRKIPFLSSMDTPWHDESILVGLYQWYGDEIPNADIVNQLEYAVIGENDVIFRGKCTETCMELCIYSNRELKQYPIQCIGQDASYQKGISPFFHTNYWEYGLHTLISLDHTICSALHRYFPEAGQENKN
ncbi:hypothetical protein [Clostridium facile]|uniref:DUF4259 domain-containing protein n=1 Tax=Clostridium facile TaxID=2763035 RepID=A0ABR7IP50_9CLOT|nr:hypothetical protein [Clostridium facile]MBC5786898.1 hypothetical protein [Clostridium facile]